MQSICETWKPPAIDATEDEDNYHCKTVRLHTLILHATGEEISSFPASVQRQVNILARTASILGLDDPSAPAFSVALSRLSTDRLRVQLHHIHLRKAEKELTEAISLAEHRQRLAGSWIKSCTDLDANTTSLECQRRAMTAKAKEYQQEIGAITSGSLLEQDNSPTITSLISLQESLRQKERDLKLMKTQLSTFEGLSPNLELAKQELKVARENQIRLINTREKLLGRMTLGVN